MKRDCTVFVNKDAISVSSEIKDMQTLQISIVFTLCGRVLR